MVRTMVRRFSFFVNALTEECGVFASSQETFLPHHESLFRTEDRASIRRDLLAWFDREKRDLPWRQDRQVYGTWISEIMLQQTTVKTVIPYYEKFLQRFPDVGALAAAPLDEVLTLWSGLGYYRRARNLHAAARKVVDELGGQMPSDREGWADLPGVGDYASGAIASMALKEVVPALDANAQRVLLRLAVEDPSELGDWKPARLRHLAQSMVDPERPGDWNEAVMELGALVCPAGTPRCAECPVRAHCLAGPSGNAAFIGKPASKPPTLNVVTAQLVVLWRNRILLLAPGKGMVLPGPAGIKPARGDFGSLHQGLWSLPLTGWYDKASLDPDPWKTESWAHQVTQALRVDFLPDHGAIHLAGSCRHAITKYRIQAQTWVWRLPEEHPELTAQFPESSAPRRAPGPNDQPCLWRFVKPGEGNPPVSSLVSKGLSAARLTMG